LIFLEDSSSKSCSQPRTEERQHFGTQKDDTEPCKELRRTQRQGQSILFHAPARECGHEVWSGCSGPATLSGTNAQHFRHWIATRSGRFSPLSPRLGRSSERSHKPLPARFPPSPTPRYPAPATRRASTGPRADASAARGSPGQARPPPSHLSAGTPLYRPGVGGRAAAPSTMRQAPA
jgi:hypothetical protein